MKISDTTAWNKLQHSLTWTSKTSFKNLISSNFYGSIAQAGLGFLVVQASRSHSDKHAVGRTPLDKWSARLRDIKRYLNDNANIQKRKTSMPPAGFEPTIPAGERSQTHALDRKATGIGINKFTLDKILLIFAIVCIWNIQYCHLCTVRTSNSSHATGLSAP